MLIKNLNIARSLFRGRNPYKKDLDSIHLLPLLPQFILCLSPDSPNYSSKKLYLLNRSKIL